MRLLGTARMQLEMPDLALALESGVAGFAGSAYGRREQTNRALICSATRHRLDTKKEPNGACSGEVSFKVASVPAHQCPADSSYPGCKPYMLTVAATDSIHMLSHLSSSKYYLKFPVYGKTVGPPRIRTSHCVNAFASKLFALLSAQRVVQ
ncbi:hypothetical protein BDV10DRAFT_8707 [Aspergillus recurvatus]